MTTKEQEKLDYFNQELQLGDIVVAADGHKLACYTIIKITDKMVRIAEIGETVARRGVEGVLRYPKELFKVDSELASFHVLRTKNRDAE